MTTLVDANILLYASNEVFDQHERALCWLEQALSDDTPVGLPWISLLAFVRISTNHRVFDPPLSVQEATEQVASWCAAPCVWHPEPGARFHRHLARFLTTTNAAGNLVTDGYLAALAKEHGLTVVSADTDFARFAEIRWFNPLAA